MSSFSTSPAMPSSSLSAGAGPSRSPPPSSASSTTSTTSTITATGSSRQRPLHLQPPADINILPPSPIDAKSGSPFLDSPESTSDEEDQGGTRGLKSKAHPHPLASNVLSTSPAKDPGLLLTPQLSRTISNDSNGSASGSALSTRAPSPSSPDYRPKRGHHRRLSSTHKVRETVDGEQKTTADGRLVNQYRIGKSLGKGAYAKVELGVDITTGKEYAIKEYSKSRLSYQALQERQRQSTRSRLRKAQRRKDQGFREGVRDKIKETWYGAPPGDTPHSSGPWAVDEEREDDPLGLIRREIAVMKKLDHPNLVHLYEAISVPDADALFLVLEYLPGGTLMEVQVGGDTSHAEPPFPREQAREYFRQLCLGLEYLHHNEVVHRDIKPDNVLLSADRQIVKLCDFGVSEIFVNRDDDRIKHTGGSPAFLSPESFQSNTSDVHGKAVDIWALGVTLYCMLTGKLPFNVENPIELFEVVKTKEPEYPADWDTDVLDLMVRFFEKNPTERIRMFQIRQHPWVTSHGAEQMISKDDNLYYVGQQVEEPTQEELGLAIRPLRGIFTLIRAVQKMRRLGNLRRSLSGATSGSSVPSSSIDSYATTSTVSEGQSTSPTEVDDADRLKAMGSEYDNLQASPMSMGSEAGDLDEDIIDELRLDPGDKLGLRDTLRQSFRGLKIETSERSLHHHSSSSHTNSHQHAHHPDSTHRHPHHVHHLRHHLHRARVPGPAPVIAQPAQQDDRTDIAREDSMIIADEPLAPDQAQAPAPEDKSGIEITEPPVSETAAAADDGFQITDSPVSASADDAGIQITDSPVSDAPDTLEDQGEPVMIMDSPTSI